MVAVENVVLHGVHSNDAANANTKVADDGCSPVRVGINGHLENTLYIVGESRIRVAADDVFDCSRDAVCEVLEFAERNRFGLLCKASHHG